MNKYVALLRGINVGGKNIIKMVDLKECFEDLGLTEVCTYIQSGNVIFSANEWPNQKLYLEIEKALSIKFNYDASIVLLSQKQLKQVIHMAPEGFGENPTKYRYDVLFCKEPLSSKEAFELLPVNPGVDQAYRGSSVVYCARLSSKATQSRLSRLVSMPMYKNITIRNWNTTKKLMQLMSEK